MTITPTSLLSLPIITTGTESGTWGDDVNNGLTSYLDIAIAGTSSVTVTTADVTLTNTAGTSSATGITSTTAQYAILYVTGAMTAARTLTVPSKWYIVYNNTTGGYALTFKSSTSGSGVTLVNGEKAILAWTGSDYIKVAGLNGPGAFTTLTASGNVNLSPLTTAGTMVLSPGGAATISPGLVGTMDNVTIGATTRAAGSFTALNANASVNLVPLTTAGTMLLSPGGALTINSGLVGTMDNVTIGATTVAAATFAKASTTSVAVTFSAGSTTVNCALSNVFTMTLTANIAVAPTLSNPADGQTINWFLTQDGTGSRTMIWPSSFKWSGGLVPVLSTTASSVDLLVATYRSSTGFWYASLAKAFS